LSATAAQTLEICSNPLPPTHTRTLSRLRETKQEKRGEKAISNKMLRHPRRFVIIRAEIKQARWQKRLQEIASAFSCCSAQMKEFLICVSARREGFD